jgi:hypothetical protein
MKIADHEDSKLHAVHVTFMAPPKRPWRPFYSIPIK